MTNEEINQTIARACGWQLKESRYLDGSPAGKSWVDHTGFGRDLPDYVTDLNAMHHAEEALTPNGQLAYLSLLSRRSDGVIWFRTIHATARERAMAFLDAVNWIGEKTLTRKQSTPGPPAASPGASPPTPGATNDPDPSSADAPDGSEPLAGDPPGSPGEP